MDEIRSVLVTEARAAKIKVLDLRVCLVERRTTARTQL